MARRRHLLLRDVVHRSASLRQTSSAEAFSNGRYVVGIVVGLDSDLARAGDNAHVGIQGFDPGDVARLPFHLEKQTQSAKNETGASPPGISRTINFILSGPSQTGGELDHDGDDDDL